MIPFVPITIRLILGLILMTVAVAFGTAADWMLPEMREEKSR